MGFISANVGRLMGSTSTALAGAQALLAGESQGLAFDFTDQSAYIVDTGTPANNYNSTGIVSNGALVGPSGKLTYTSASNKLTLQSDGLLRYQAHNLYLNSAAPANQSITVVSGASYAVTITGTVSVTASGAATGTWTAGTNTFTAATTTLTLGSTSGSGTVHVRRTPSNDDYIATAGAAKYALPIEYDTSGTCLGLLGEDARTNLCLQGADFSTTWTTTECTVSANAATAPNGLTHADKLIPSTNNAAHYVNQSITFTAAPYAFSAYCKADGYDYIQIFDSVAGTAYANFNLSTGAVGNTSDYTASIESVGNGWYRVCIVFTMTASARTMRFCPINADTASRAPAFAGDGTSGVLIWGAQAELGSFPTSPIITYGAAATRDADPLSQLTSTFPLSATAGSFYAYVAPYAGADLAGIVSLNDGTGNEEIVIYKDASANIVAQVEDGGVNQLAPLDSTANASSGTAFKVALAWASNDFALSADGTAAQTDASGTLPTVTTLEIGVDQANNYFNGHIKAISYVPRRKSNAELQAETA